MYRNKSSSRKEAADMGKIETIMDKLGGKFRSRKEALEAGFRKAPVKSAKRFLDEQIQKQRKNIDLHEQRRARSRSKSAQSGSSESS